jgi:holin-like protein
LRQLGIILTVSFLGEILGAVVPLPVPASIYGLVLMYLCLQLKLLPVASVRETGEFLLEIMPLMFIPAAVGLLKSWDVLRPVWLPVLSITVVSTVAVLAVSGLVTQAVIRLERRSKEKEARHE